MGMLFNTDATKDVLRQLNEYFSSRNIGGVRVRANDFQNWPLATGTSDYVINTMGIAPTIGYASSPGAWRRFLGHLDTNPNAKANNNELCATTIGDAIYAALSDYSFAEIEFFAVPDSNDTHHISVEVTDVRDGRGDRSKVISVYTMTYDQIRDP